MCCAALKMPLCTCLAPRTAQVSTAQIVRSKRVGCYPSMNAIGSVVRSVSRSWKVDIRRQCRGVARECGKQKGGTPPAPRAFLALPPKAGPRPAGSAESRARA
eukprot:2721789-Rhodomonas_salina.1